MEEVENKNKHNHKHKESSLITWGPAASIIVIISIYIISQIIAAFLINIYPVIKHWDSTQSANWLNNSVYAQFIITVLIEGLSLFFLYIFLKRRKSNFKSLGLNRYPKFKDLAYTLAGFLVYFAIYYIFLTILTHTVSSFNAAQKQQIGFSTSTSGPQLMLVFISLVLLPPIVEEIMFRGFLYSGLKTKLPIIYAAILTSIIFASLHLLEGSGGLLWVGGLDTFVLSMVLVYLREKTGALYSSMGLHMLKNFLAFASLFLFHFS